MIEILCTWSMPCIINKDFIFTYKKYDREGLDVKNSKH